MSEAVISVLRQMRDNLVGAKAVGLRRERQALSAAILTLERRESTRPLINLAGVPGPFALGVLATRDCIPLVRSDELGPGRYLLVMEIGNGGVTVHAVEEPQS